MTHPGGWAPLIPGGSGASAFKHIEYLSNEYPQPWGRPLHALGVPGFVPTHHDGRLLGFPDAERRSRFRLPSANRSPTVLRRRAGIQGISVILDRLSCIVLIARTVTTTMAAASHLEI